MIQTPYLVTTELGEAVFRAAEDRGVDVRILTNSLAATDNIMAFSGYKRGRDGLLDAGVELYEELQERFPALKVQASGGIGSEGDIEAVAATGVHGCIVGRALLEGRVSMDAIGRFQDGRAAEVGR